MITQYLLLTKQYSEYSHTLTIQVIPHKASKLQDITKSLSVKTAIINISVIVNCCTTMSILRHKHGWNQECYNMHVLSYCTNKKKKVVCQITPQRQISMSPFFTICVRQHITLRTKPTITIFTREQEEGFPLKFGTQIHEVNLNMHMTCWTAPCQTGSLWTRSCKPNHGLHQQITVWDLRFSEILCSVER